LTLELLSRDRDRDILSGGKVSLTPVTTRDGLLRDERGAGTIVGVQRHDARKGTSARAMDDNIGTARVQLTVALVVVPDPVQDHAVARRGIGRDRDRERVGAVCGRVRQTGLELVLDHHPGGAIVVR